MAEFAIRTVRVDGKFTLGTLDSLDAGLEPDTTPLVNWGIKLTPTPRVNELHLATPPETKILEPILLITDATGVVKNPDTGDLEVRIWADYPVPGGGVQRIMWHSEITPPGSTAPLISKDWYVPLDATAVDLTTIDPVPGTTIINLEAWELVKETARAARDVAVLAAQSAALDADAALAARDEALSHAELFVAPAKGVVDAMMGGPTSPLISDPASATASALALKTGQTLGYVFATEAPYNAIPNGITDATAALNAASNAAFLAGKIFYAHGDFRISDTVTIKGHADLGGAQFRWHGAPGKVALQVGEHISGKVSFRYTAILPRVINFRKSGTGWGGDAAGSIGVRVTNTNTWNITVPYIASFETGLSVYGFGQGNVHCTFNMGHLHNNKINHLVDADAGGWSNQNLFLNGKYGHDSSEGVNIAGVRHISVPATTNTSNNNTWLNTSLEGSTPEFHMEGAGIDNQWLFCRWECSDGARVNWLAGAQRNLILGGNYIHVLIQSYAAGALLQDVILPGRWDLGSNAATAVGDKNYVVRVNNTGVKMKPPTSDHPRIFLDAIAGKVFFGAGTAAPTLAIATLGTSGLALQDGSLYSNVDGIHDIGIKGSYRFRDIRASRCIVTGTGATADRPSAAIAGAGAMWFNSTTSKPCWSTGAIWVDATGATV